MNLKTIFLKSFQQEFIKQAQMNYNLLLPIGISGEVIRKLVNSKENRRLQALTHGLITGTGMAGGMGLGGKIGRELVRYFGEPFGQATSDRKLVGEIAGMILGGMLSHWGTDALIKRIYGPKKIKDIYKNES